MTNPNTKNSRPTLSKAERLCSKLIFERLFAENQSFRQKGVRFVYLIENQPIATLGPPSGNRLFVAFVAPKKLFRRANKRNRIKRLLREAFRLNKRLLTPALEESGLYLYVALVFANKELPTFVETNQWVERGLLALKNKLPATAPNEP